MTYAKGVVLPVLIVLAAAAAQSADHEALRLLVEQDQADRQWTKPPEAKEIEAMSKRDRERRAQVARWLSRDELKTANDFDRAALVFQHGDRPDDFLAALELAVVAAKLGKQGSMPCLAKDRFLTNLGRPQRFGSQFRFEGEALKPNPMEENGPASATDGLRMDMSHPPLSVLFGDGGPKSVDELGERQVAAREAIGARREQRQSPEFLAKADESPEARELAALASRHQGERSVRRVLELYAADAIVGPAQHANAARILLDAGNDAAVWSLGQDFAIVATGLQDANAPKLFARLTDRWLIALGREPRYVAPAKRWPAVRRAFGL